MSIAITNIGSLVTNDQSLGSDILGEIENAALVIENDQIAWVGITSDVPDTDQQIDVAGKAVIPGFVDSHAHLLFAGERSKEFQARMKGEKYSAGGIQSTVVATREATNEDLEKNMLTHIEMQS
jgi:imidazolonepropionase